MDTNIKALAFGLFVTLVIVTFWVASRVMSNDPPASGVAQNQPITNLAGNPNVNGLRRQSSDDSVRLIRQSQLAEATHRINQLEATLARKSKLLERKDALLEENGSQYNELKAEFDSYLAFMARFGELDQTTESPTENGEIVQGAELTSLLAESKSKLAAAKSVERTLKDEVADRNQQLEEMSDELDQLQIAAMLDNDESLHAVASEVLTRTGPAAVPSLINLLSDERTDVRIWAANHLGMIGPDSEEAIPSLQNLLSDPDERVRAATRLALNAILD